MTPQEIADLFIKDIEPWYNSQRTRTGTINTNVMAVGMVMIDHMAASFPLTDAAYVSPQGSQVKELGGAKIREILARYGETRPFRSEGGRTSRGSLPLAREFATLLNTNSGASPYQTASDSDQEAARERMQRWIVTLLQDQYFNRQRIEAELDHRRPVKFAVRMLLAAASERGGTTAGAVAQHLVGAKLSLRFPGQVISNESYTTADQQTERPGDFLVGDTAIHVTMSPGDNLMSNRCRSNLQAGYRPLVLVPEDREAAARQLADNAGLDEKVYVNSIEDFVGQNIEEIAGFSDTGIKTGLRALLERYNERVQAVESDPSLRIKIPENL
jgi:hypothetical protein